MLLGYSLCTVTMDKALVANHLISSCSVSRHPLHFLYQGCSLDNIATHRSDIFHDWFGLVEVVASCKNCQDILRIKTVE